MTNPTQEALLAALPVWEQFFNDYRPPVILDAAADVIELRRRLVNLRRRLRDGPHAPLRLAFFGPTGSGKSKLFSSMIGKHISGSGFRRPFTKRAVYFVHEDWRALTASLAGELETHSDQRWKQAILVDTPDFDSVEVANRAEAERVYLESDGFFFVTDGLKYADASTWEYLRRIQSSEKLFLVVLNKVNSEAIVESFRDRYFDTFGPSESPQGVDVPAVVVPELALGDDELIPADHPALVGLNEVANKLSAAAGPATSAEMFAQEGKGLVTESAKLTQRCEELLSALAELQSSNTQRLEDAKQRLDHRLSTGIAPEVRDEVYQRVLKRLEKIDLLRYPRRLLALPWRGLKTLLAGWLPEKEAPPDEASGADPVTSETFHLLESELIRIADETRLDILDHPGLEQLIDRETYQKLRIDHDEAKQLFAEHYEQFTVWLADHARETASEITGENKAKFIISQVLFNTLLVTAQIHTGGALSLFEIGMDGVLSPIVAKAIGMAIGSDKVKEFEAAAHQQHQNSLGRILQLASDRYTKFLAAPQQELTDLLQQLSEIVQYDHAMEQLVADFRQQAEKPAGEG